MNQIITPMFMIFMVIFIIWRKQRKAKKPLKGSGWRLLIPLPIFLVMFGLFFVQVTHLPPNQYQIPASWEWVVAFALGIVFGIPLLIKTSYEARNDGFIYMKPNKGFMFIFVALILIRLGLKEYFQDIDPIALAFLTFTMALAYLGVWRIGAFLKYRNVWKSLKCEK